MNFTTQITINRPRQRVIELIRNPDNIAKWQPGLQSVELLAGEQDQVGARSRIVFEMRGLRLELIETQGNWYLVKDANGVKGYVHQSAVTTGNVSLSGIAPGKKGASDEELALAAKGFNEGNEQKLRGSKGYNFAAVEWVMDQDVTNAAVANFIKEGKLK